MTTTFVARKTTYNGIEMRSRLEARVAAWLRSMEVPWTYEPRAFASDNGQYLPDFQINVQPAILRNSPVYLEVKGVIEPAEAEAIIDRMETIRTSEPGAILLLTACELLEKTGGIHVLLPGAAGYRYGAFVACPSCSWVTLGYSICTRRHVEQGDELLFLAFCPLCEAETLVRDDAIRLMPEYGS